ncbi:MAG TPA: LytTR family DNA-binding domain-containing protein [Vicinamibacteria bacterium]|jgi:two-component system LytT family response regulator
MIRALIADDEPLARKKIRTLLEREPDVEVAGECGSGPEAARLIRELEPDLVFLDIEMPELDGLSVLSRLPSSAAPLVIFVTAYDQYAVRAFAVKALDYLLKPFDRRRFRTALERAREQLRHSGEPAEIPLSRLLVRSGDGLSVLKVDDVDWVEAADNYVKVHALGETHLLRETLAHLQSRLDPARFLRIHRSTLVNLERIQSLHPLFHGDQIVVLRDGTELTLSRRYRNDVESLLGRPSRH